jgi:hypothetical protein
MVIAGVVSQDLSQVRNTKVFVDLGVSRRCYNPPVGPVLRPWQMRVPQGSRAGSPQQTAAVLTSADGERESTIESTMAHSGCLRTDSPVVLTSSFGSQAITPTFAGLIAAPYSRLIQWVHIESVCFSLKRHQVKCRNRSTSYKGSYGLTGLCPFSDGC